MKIMEETITITYNLDVQEAIYTERLRYQTEKLEDTRNALQFVAMAKEKQKADRLIFEQLTKNDQEKDLIIQSKDEKILALLQQVEEQKEEIERLRDKKVATGDASCDIILADSHGAKICLIFVLYALANLAKPLLVMRKTKKPVPVSLLMEVMGEALHINLKGFQSEISHAMLTKSLPEHLAIFNLLAEAIIKRYNKGIE